MSTGTGVTPNTARRIPSPRRRGPNTVPSVRPPVAAPAEEERPGSRQKTRPVATEVPSLLQSGASAEEDHKDTTPRARAAQEDRAVSRTKVRPTPVGNDAAVAAANVRVVCRCRPMNDREKKAGTVPAAVASTEKKEVAIVRNVGARQTRQHFHFDEVLSSFSTQEDVFAATLQPLVGQVLAGYDATAFAYGQTGTGKTYTMEGDADSEDHRGLMPRAAAAVLDELASGRYVESTVTVSYLEIYNEELSDLLAPHGSDKKLELMDTGANKGVCCVGLAEVAVSSLADILDLVRRAQERRRVAETHMNARSSRSHCIFTMKVQSRRRVASGEIESVGKLHLVDLAGSECAKKASGAYEGEDSQGLAAKEKERNAAAAAEQERERRNINQSLLTLGRVIAALRDEKSGRVPYRDSKLTRLLRDALGGSCRTVLIATISPAISAVEETASTLTYAEQAEGIQNRPVATSLFRRTGTSSLDSSVGTIGVPQTATEWAEAEMKMVYLQQEVEEIAGKLAREMQVAQEHLQRAQKAEDAIDDVKADLARAEVLVQESRALHASAATTARALEQDMAAAMSKAEESRAALLQETADLQRRRTEEERLVATLTKQRRSLEHDLEATTVALDAQRTELAATQTEVEELRSSQARECAQALEAIVGKATEELERLKAKQDESAKAVLGRLGTASARADDAIAAASTMKAHVIADCEEASDAANAWSRSIASSAETLGRRVDAALGDVTSSIASATGQLSDMAAASENHATPEASAGGTIFAGSENLDCDSILSGHSLSGTASKTGDGVVAGEAPRTALREVNVG